MTVLSYFSFRVLFPLFSSLPLRFSYSPFFLRLERIPRTPRTSVSRRTSQSKATAKSVPLIFPLRRGNVKLGREKGNGFSVGPVVLAFFLFVVLGSGLFSASVDCSQRFFLPDSNSPNHPNCTNGTTRCVFFVCIVFHSFFLSQTFEPEDNLQIFEDIHFYCKFLVGVELWWKRIDERLKKSTKNILFLFTGWMFQILPNRGQSDFRRHYIHFIVSFCWRKRIDERSKKLTKTFRFFVSLVGGDLGIRPIQPRQQEAEVRLGDVGCTPDSKTWRRITIRANVVCCLLFGEEGNHFVNLGFWQVDCETHARVGPNRLGFLGRKGEVQNRFPYFLNKPPSIRKENGMGEGRVQKTPVKI